MRNRDLFLNLIIASHVIAVNERITLLLADIALRCRGDVSVIIDRVSALPLRHDDSYR